MAQLEAIESFEEVVLNSGPDITYTMEFGHHYPTTEEEFESNTYNPFISEFKSLAL